MLQMLVALAAFVSPDVAPTPTVAAPPAAKASSSARIDRFADRPRARIAFARDVNNFEIKRDGSDDVLYLATRRDRWFRSEINCFGIADPTHAQGLLPLDHVSGFDSFSRIGLVSFGERTTECRLSRLVELTPEEAVELRLIRPRAAVKVKAAPAS